MGIQAPRFGGGLNSATGRMSQVALRDAVICACLLNNIKFMHSYEAQVEDTKIHPRFYEKYRTRFNSTTTNKYPGYPTADEVPVYEDFDGRKRHILPEDDEANADDADDMDKC